MPFNVRKAVELYYGQLELSTSDIQEIYGCCRTKAVSLKNQVRKFQVENDITFMSANRVSTKAAFRCWGLNIKELTHNYKKLLTLNLLDK